MSTGREEVGSGGGASSEVVGVALVVESVSAVEEVALESEMYRNVVSSEAVATLLLD